MTAQDVGLGFAMWLMGINLDGTPTLLPEWRSSHRLSLGDLHSCVNFNELNLEVGEHTETLASGFLKASIVCGSLGRSIAQLCRNITLGRTKEAVAMTLEDSRFLVAGLPKRGARNSILVPSSRVYQALTDIYEASGDSHAASAAWV